MIDRITKEREHDMLWYRGYHQGQLAWEMHAAHAETVHFMPTDHVGNHEDPTDFDDIADGDPRR